MFQIALPILGVSDSAASEAFYCEKLGFERRYFHRPNAESLDPCWMGVARGNVHLVLSSFECDGPPGSQRPSDTLACERLNITCGIADKETAF